MTNHQENNFLESGSTEFLAKYGIHRVNYSFFDKFRFVLGAGLGLIAALAWDETLKSAFDALFPKTDSGWHSFIYALFLTIVATIVTFGLKIVSKRLKK